jgi:hypothetical protein
MVLVVFGTACLVGLVYLGHQLENEKLQSVPKFGAVNKQDLSQFRAFDARPLIGVTPDHIAKEFPVYPLERDDWENGLSSILENWGGYKLVYFNYNGRGRLKNIEFVLHDRLPVKQCQKLLAKFNALPAAEYLVEAPGVMSYREMNGVISTVNLLYSKDRFKWRMGCDSFAIHFNIGWNE